MGAGCSFCGPEASSYDLPRQRNQTNGPNLSSGEVRSNQNLQEEKSGHNQGIPFQDSKGREMSLTKNKEVVSQSHCEVKVAYSWSHVYNPDFENSKFDHDAKSNQSSNFEAVSSQPVQEHLFVDDFQPGHFTRFDNSTEKQAVGHAKTSGANELLNELTRASQEEIQTVVDRCWEDIENTCRDLKDKKSSPLSVDQKIRGWRVVRLFVSSTFADYHAEREVLVKKVCLNSTNI